MPDIFLPPDDTVRAFEQRGQLRSSIRWSEMMHEEHAAAFTVAKVAKLDLLDAIRGSLDDVIRNGGTFEEWQRNLRPELEKAGWWGEVRDPGLTGTDRTVIVGEQRLRTIFDTNVRMSMAQGHWARIQAAKEQRPFLRYSAVNDGRTRPLHRLWGGLADPARGRPARAAIILPVDHPWWRTHFPPCGWRCRCSVDQLSQRNLDDRGLKVTLESDDRLHMGVTPFVDAVGRKHFVPRGVDPGFAYNPGTAHLHALADKATRTISEALASGADAQAREALSQIVADAAYDQFVALPAARFPALIIDKDLQASLGANVRLVQLSDATMAKQLAKAAQQPNRADVALYRLIASLPEGAQAVLEDRGSLVFVIRKEPGWVVATVKRTAAGDELFLTSVRYQDKLSARLLNAPVIRGGL